MSDLLAHCMGSSGSLWVVNTIDGTVVDISENVGRFLGVPADQIIGRMAWDLGPNLTEETWPDLVGRVMRLGVVEVESLATGAEGRPRVMRFRFEPAVGPDGQPLLLGRAEHVPAEQGPERLGDEYWFRCITAYGDDCFWLYDVRNDTVTTHGRWYRQLGLEPHEQESLDGLQSRMHPDDLAALGPRYAALVAGRVEQLSGRVRLRHADGTWHWMRHRAHVVGRDVHGAPIEILGHDVDITPEVEAEQRALDGERDLDRLLDRIPTAVLVYGPDGRPVRWNARAARMLGATRETLPETIAARRAAGWEMVDETGATIPSDASPIMRVLRTGEPVVDRIIGVRNTDGWHWGLMTVTPSFDGAGRLVDVVASITDITEARRLEAAVARAQRLESLGRLAGGVAHDFNNLLTVVASIGEMLGAELSEDSEFADDVAELQQVARQGAEVTRQLLSYARPASETARPVHLGRQVHASIGVLGRLLPVDIALVTQVPDDLWTVRIDPGQFDQILVNLTVNAADAIGHHPGQVTIALSNHCDTASDGRRREWVRLSVTDDGCGMTDEVQARAVEPFFTTKDVGAGTGLGLSTCFGLVRQSGGGLRIDSAPGAGTTIEIDFPRVHTVASDSAPPGEVGAVATGELILLVEDESAVRRLAHRALTQNGYRVVLAESGRAALARIEQGLRPALIISDVAMPGMDGSVLVRAVHRDHPDIPVLFVSGHDDPTLERHGIDRARVDFLPKPFGPRALLAGVRDMLQRSK